MKMRRVNSAAVVWNVVFAAFARILQARKAYSTSLRLSSFVLAMLFSNIRTTVSVGLLFVAVAITGAANAGPKNTYAATGADQVITAPATAYGMKVKLWGGWWRPRNRWNRQIRCGRLYWGRI